MSACAHADDKSNFICILHLMLFVSIVLTKYWRLKRKATLGLNASPCILIREGERVREGGSEGGAPFRRRVDTLDEESRLRVR